MLLVLIKCYTMQCDWLLRFLCVAADCCCLVLCSEENVWKLCEFVRDGGTVPLDELLVVFISNASRMVRSNNQESRL